MATGLAFAAGPVTHEAALVGAGEVAGRPGPDGARHAGEAPRRRRPGFAAVGVLGELLMTAGVVVVLFVVWQLWWTDVEAGAVQAGIVSTLVESGPSPVAVVAEPRTEAAPRIEVPPEGTTFALLRVPRWGDGYVMPISEGVGAAVLDRLGIGHYPETAMPGQVGNLALAGHRQGHGRPFYSIEALAPGDALVVESPGAWYVYRVTVSEVVSPGAVEVIAAVPGRPGAVPTTAVITLTTCHPVFSSRERYVVHGVFESWMLKADGMPGVLAPGIIGANESER